MKPANRFISGDSRTLEQIFHSLGGKEDFMIKLANRFYIVIITHSFVKINPITELKNNYPIPLIHNPERYTVTIDLEDNVFVLDCKKNNEFEEIFRMNFDSYSLERPIL